MAASLEAAVADATAEMPDVTLSAGGSNTLVDQIAEGAPADVLITADTRTMDRAVDEGLAAEPVAIATNHLVLALAPGNPAGIGTFEDALTGRRLVVCAPEVPCGAATVQLLDLLGLTAETVSEEQSVSDVAGKVASGEADAGIVYETDALAADLETIEIPQSGEVPTTAWAAPTVSAGAGADAVMDLLTSDAFAQRLADLGFGPAQDPGTASAP